MTTNNTRASLDAAIDRIEIDIMDRRGLKHVWAEIDAYIRIEIKAAWRSIITAHVEAEVARRLAAAPEVEEALGEVWSECEHDGRCGKSMADDDHAAARCARCVADGLDRCWCRCAPAARHPCAGWVDGMARPGGWIATPLRAEKLLIGDLWALVYTLDGRRHWWLTCFTSDGYSARYVDGDFAAAQLAAEDALLAVADEIRRAVGR